MEYFNTFAQYLKNTHGKRLWRIPLSTGYECPNRLDGSEGCTFCNGTSFIPRYLKDDDTLENQIERGIAFFSRRYKVDDFYGYFQFNSSTYGDREELLSKYETVLKHEHMKGLVISTRPDYIDREMIDAVARLNKRYGNKDIWIELGLQTVNDEILRRINRNHTYHEFKEAVRVIKAHSGFKITVHMIIGLPGESVQMIKDGVKRLFLENDLDGVKFRLLEIIPGTVIEDEYRHRPDDFPTFDFHSYSGLLCDLLEMIPEQVVIMRLMNFKSGELLANDGVKVLKNDVIAEVNAEFKRRGTKQGVLYERKKEA